MSADTWSDVARMAGCFGMVAAGAVPVGLVCRAVVGRSPQLPFRRHSAPWAGLDVFVALFVVMLVVPVLAAQLLSESGLYRRVYGPEFRTTGTADSVEGAVRLLWVGILAAPLQLGGLLVASRLMFPQWTPWGTPRGWVSQVAVGVGWWVVLTPAVLVFHGCVNALFTAQGWGGEDHPLTRLGTDRPELDRILLAIRAGVVAPVVEEVLFRGVLLGWLLTRSRQGAEFRVWVTLGWAVAFPVAPAFHAILAGGDVTAGPTGFAVALLFGWGILRRWVRERRTVGAVYASAALFGAIHSSVWPTPVPLFALGLGLGWVAVRTNGILAPVVVHGLFNTVSVLFVLSGSAN